MNLSLINIDKKYWYRGFKHLYIIKQNNNFIKFSNNDILKYDNGLYLNNKLLTNLNDLSNDEIIDLYLDYLISKGYKFI